ncbi:MAG: mechanosensitive ion channel family protein [Bacteroidia bacterium]
MNTSEIYNLISDKLSNWLKELITLLPNLLLAAVVLVIGYFIAKVLRRIAIKISRKFSDNKTLNNLFSSIVYLFILGIVCFTALSILQLDKAVTSILAGAGIFGLALAFAFQDIASNFMSGIFISFRRPIHIGDLVKLNDKMGIVQNINLRDTILLSLTGQTIIIPNKEVFQSSIENYTTLGKRRFDLSVGISYGDNLDEVKSITLNAVKDLPGLMQDENISFYFVEFGDSSINFVLQLWVSSTKQSDYLQIGSDAIQRIKNAFNSQGIVIPFPIRTLDFGIKGGKELSEVPLSMIQKNENFSKTSN